MTLKSSEGELDEMKSRPDITRTDLMCAVCKDHMLFPNIVDTTTHAMLMQPKRTKNLDRKNVGLKQVPTLNM